MGQINLMKFLDAIKAGICTNHLIEMPLKTLYIAYILTNLDEWENSLKDEYYHQDDKRDFKIARKYQKEFTEQYPEQIEIYNDIVANGGNFWSYYNGSEIYENREQLEACELWDQARKVVDVIAKCSINNVSTIWTLKM